MDVLFMGFRNMILWTGPTNSSPARPRRSSSHALGKCGVHGALIMVECHPNWWLKSPFSLVKSPFSLVKSCFIHEKYEEKILSFVNGSVLRKTEVS